MTRRERRFVQHYLVTADATAAALRLGYSALAARQTGARLLQKPLIRLAIAHAQTEQAVRTGITLERVLREYLRIGLADLGRVLDWGKAGVRVRPMAEWSEDEAAAVAAVSFADRADGRQQVRLELHNKKFALAVLERYFNVDEPPDDPEGARERLFAKLDRMVAEEDAWTDAVAAAGGDERAASKLYDLDPRVLKYQGASS